MKNTILNKYLTPIVCLSLLAFSVILMLLAGCASRPPTALEQRFFTVSNPPPVIEIKTNVFTVNVTKTNEIVVPITNLQNVLEFRTNVIVQTVTEPRTNIEVTATAGGQILIPNANSKEVVQTVSGAVSLFNPAVGGMVGAGLAAFFSVWGWFRSNKRYVAVGSNLTQQIEVIRNFIKTLPDGDKYDMALIQFLQQNQAEAGVLQNVMALLENNLDKGNAIVSAQNIRTVIDSLSKPSTPSSSTPST